MNKAIWTIVVVLAIGGTIAAIVLRKQQSETPAASPTTSAASAATAPSDLTIAVVLKGTTHAYWTSVREGATQASHDLGVSVTFKAPVQEDDRSGQIRLVQQVISDNVSGIVLAPLDYTALLPPVEEARDRKIPVVIIDSSLQGTVGQDFVCYVGTDNKAAGHLGGQELARLMGGKGKFILLRYSVGSASTDQREQGFLDAMNENPGMQPLVTNRYGGATAGEAQAASMNMLAQIRQADGIFTPNESTTHGMLSTLEQNNLAGKIHFVGFDVTPELVDALKKGEIDALVSQNPTKMGYQGVKACVDYIRGTPQQPVQDSGFQLITRDNLDTPEVKKLLPPGS